jgi:hypothetical protein
MMSLILPLPDARTICTYYLDDENERAYAGTSGVLRELVVSSLILC